MDKEKNKALETAREQLEEALILDPVYGPIVLAEKMQRERRDLEDERSKNLQSVGKIIRLSAERMVDVQKSGHENAEAVIESVKKELGNVADTLAEIEAKDSKAVEDGLKNIEKAIADLAAKEIPAPEVNVEAPIVNVETPTVDVKVPEPKVIQETKQTEALVRIMRLVLQAIRDQKDDLKKTEQKALVQNDKARQAIPVVLVDRTRKKFYDAVTGMSSAPGGSGGGNNRATIRALDNTYSQKYEYSGQDLIYHGKASPGAPSSSPVWAIKKYTYVGGKITAIEWADGNSDFDNVWDDRAGLSYS